MGGVAEVGACWAVNLRFEKLGFRNDARIMRFTQGVGESTQLKMLRVDANREPAVHSNEPNYGY